MDNSTSFLDPADSPHGLRVRRLNHVPLYLIGAAASVVAIIIAVVAIDKGKQGAAKTADHGGNTDQYAQLAAGDRHGYTQAFHAPTPWPVATPFVAATPMPTPDLEMEARKKAFYDALFAQSAVSDPLLAQREAAAAAANAVKPEATGAGSGMPAAPVAPSIEPAPPRAEPAGPNSLSSYAGPKDRWALGNRVEKPASKYVLQTGWLIPALLLSGMESELPGTIIAQVSQDVYDSPSGRFLLIPQGSRLVGEYSNAISYGQSRIFVAWQRIIFPNGNTFDIDAMPGVDGQGEAGFHDKTDVHFIRIFGSALLMSAITGGIQLSQPHQNNESAPNAGSTLSAALGQQLGAATSALLEKNLSIPPTLKVRPGYRFSVIAVKDLVFPGPYVVPNY